MKRYRANNRASASGVVFLLAVAIFGGLIVGALIVFLLQWWRPFSVRLSILSMPLGPVYFLPFGFLMGHLMARIVKFGKVRMPILAGICGILLVLVSYGSYHYLDYLNVRHQLYVYLDDGQSSAQGIEQKIDQQLKQQTGFSDFIGYEIFYTGVVTPNSMIGTPYATIYVPFSWHVELIILFLVWLLYIPACAFGAARKPFCTIHQRWYDDKKVFGISKDLVKTFIAFLRAGKFTNAGALLDKEITYPNAELALHCCKDCSSSDVYLELHIWRPQRYRQSGLYRALEKERTLEAWLSPAAHAEILRSVEHVGMWPIQEAL